MSTATSTLTSEDQSYFGLVGWDLNSIEAFVHDLTGCAATVVGLRTFMLDKLIEVRSAGLTFLLDGPDLVHEVYAECGLCGSGARLVSLHKLEHFLADDARHRQYRTRSFAFVRRMYKQLTGCNHK